QKKQVGTLQKEADSKLDKLFTEEQKKQLKDLRANPGRGGPGGPPGGPGGPPGGGGPPGFGGGPPGGSPVFRAYRFAPTYPGLAGKDLTPGKTIEELQAKKEEPKKGARCVRPLHHPRSQTPVWERRSRSSASSSCNGREAEVRDRRSQAELGNEKVREFARWPMSFW